MLFSKYFRKEFPVIGQPFYILDKVDSTNNYAMEQVNTGTITSGTAWFAMEQTAGKGQRGKQWLSPPGENIMLTIALQPGMLPLSRQFMLSVAVALAAYDCFKKYAGDETGIKWSNDIYWRDRKAGGILIENVLRGNTWQYAIVGIGLNINQTTFPDHLPNPVSLRQITGKTWDAVALAKELCTCLQERILTLHPSNYTSMLNTYKSLLFRFEQPGLYRMNGEYFEGIIRNVLPDGRLCLEKDGILLELNFGEIEFVITK
ncbi:BirA family transcriptional regulator, biotin operon repressor / biotin-[acetyl-CoA-carboxylase] ligase [Chitinophaga sp. CF118]|uniref:biotin--[acetyl-CoA-carboxylase] ligase n=1 Tax=Chitinophaga sp. CF118 TaxID=1884367 RepID=UPI0008E15595|nr:biotin--[acetyl-CoA-carboxylase] ligase [Chitinophaga sp. CF118]SFD29767.1 BirA family transcriptional regulator, biotin operon repressor / biotin-[acetyl-CoA-carboxylase] ligase [Chitinophaga sp. CF118]